MSWTHDDLRSAIRIGIMSSCWGPADVITGASSVGDTQLNRCNRFSKEGRVEYQTQENSNGKKAVVNAPHTIKFFR